jgi:hypothetical protein
MFRNKIQADGAINISKWKLENRHRDATEKLYESKRQWIEINNFGEIVGHDQKNYHLHCFALWVHHLFVRAKWHPAGHRFRTLKQFDIKGLIMDSIR